VKWPIVADACLAAQANINITQIHEKGSLGFIPAHFSLFFFMFEEINPALDSSQQPTNNLGRFYVKGV
jgi:hypothetical protein